MRDGRPTGALVEATGAFRLDVGTGSGGEQRRTGVHKASNDGPDETGRGNVVRQ